MPLKLEQEWSGVRVNPRCSVWCQDKVVEELGIEELRIGLTSPHTIAGMLGIAVLLSSFLNFS
jgi:hypothetical protein